ncbi:MAG: enoyl-CoA hydratase/carnithine racemase [Neptuniibacter pectenicola]|jgi:enoyl-CoA hydratase/carnithine racemase|uniref:enoyl-CoA hydratase-related protein n=1 Tax=Neptuniibacter pectenicola TaxID=1806669 RepID=UPI000798F7FA|nr:MAG: enoyl-CoA hydratase [Neptuniibacter sp. Phe_28]|tara:strand:+ start:1596 stop:2354 length:759 start_codon:yes stop_codon:yes gene_type:complete
MNEFVLAEQNNDVLEIILNRTAKKNALTLSMYEQLTQLLDSASENPEINVVLIRAEGTSFCAGNDIQDFISVGDGADAIKIIIGFLHQLAECKKPIVAAVQGNAVGIGTTMLLHCDLVVAADDINCQMPFVKLGLIPEGGSTLLFPSMVGHRQAFEMMVEGGPFNAEKALNIGLINQVVTCDILLKSARARAARLALLPSQSVQTSKMLMKKAYLQQLHHVMDEEGSLFHERLYSAEAQQAFMQFLQNKSSQ